MVLRGVPVAVVAFTSAFLLAGCGDGSRPRQAEKVASSLSGSATTIAPAARPSSTPSRPSLPEAASKHTAAGARAFLTYFYGELNEAWMRPDTSLLPRLCTEESKGCSAYQQGAEDLASRGHRFKTPPLTLESLELLETSISSATFLSTATANRAAVIDSSGALVETKAGGPLRSAVTVVWRQNGWKLSTVKGV